MSPWCSLCLLQRCPSKVVIPGLLPGCVGRLSWVQSLLGFLSLPGVRTCKHAFWYHDNLKFKVMENLKTSISFWKEKTRSGFQRLRRVELCSGKAVPFSRKRGSCALVVDKNPIPFHSSLAVFTCERGFGLVWDARHSANAKM